MTSKPQSVARRVLRDAARTATIIEVALAAAGRDPAAYSIGGDPR